MRAHSPRWARMVLQVGSLYEGRFRVVSLLRTDQFSALYLATDPLDRAVWLKVLTFDAGDHYSPQLKSRYERELRLLAPLRDPHTVRLLLYGEGALGELYLVFETGRGVPLSEVLASRTLSAPHTRIVVTQILSSLREAHQAGVIHRNLTADNVYLDERPDELHATVVDFGVARDIGSEHPSVTATGDLFGSPRYMSPEQLLREPIGPPSDLYSVGLIGYELLLGRAVLGDDSFGDAFNRTQQTTIAVVPGVLGELLARLCQRDPNARYPHAGAALEDLNRRARVELTGTLAGVTPASSPIPVAAPAAPTAPPPSTVSTGALLASTVGLVALVAVVAAIVLNKRAEPEDVQPRAQRPATRNISALTQPAAATQEPPRVVAQKVELADPATPDVASAGCGTGRKPRIRADHYIPESYDGETPMPLVLLLNGDYLAPKELLDNSGFIELADKHGWIVVAPSDDTAMTTMFVPLSQQWRTPDAFDSVRRLFNNITRNVCIDVSRVYVVSHGTGGMAGDELSCDAWVTAYVSNGYSTRHADAPKLCDRPIARLLLYPEDSPHIGTNGIPKCGLPDDTVMRIDEATAHWRARNSCSDKPTTAKVDAAQCHTWRCGLPFSLCTVPGGTLWPPGHQEYFGHQSIMGCPKDSEPKMNVTAQIEKFLLTVAPRYPEQE